jgi:SAM-dependent methyltransferase
MNNGYYDRKLSGSKLKLCYQLAPPRVRQYLEAEIDYVVAQLKPSDRVLELGCGYGRVLSRLVEKTAGAVGIDTSKDSLLCGRRDFPALGAGHFIKMNALSLGFGSGGFDCVVCIQNGISAFNVDPAALMREAIRVTRIGGLVLFSTYSELFWNERFGWFQLQARLGLLGEIDMEKSGDGVIVCKDGFRSTTVRPEQFHSLAAACGVAAELEEVDRSSLFCRIIL